MKKKQKIISLLLTLCLAAGLLPATAFAEGEITTISTLAELEAFREEVNGGETYEGKTVTLTANIDMSDTYSETTGTSWTPIGTGQGNQPLNPFKGTFDGGGHKITGLYIDSQSDYQGLFGYLDEGGTVKDLGVDGAVSGSGDYVGGVVATSDSGTVTNCYNEGAVSGSGKSVGGVVGCNRFGTVTNCHNEGTISGSGGQFGGVVGDSSYGTVTGCYNTGDVTGNYSVGGVVGSNYTRSTVTNCYNEGAVTGRNNVGGVVGTNNEGTVTNCYNEGAISRSDGDGDSVGGVVGWNYKATSKVTNCYNIGAVTGSGDKVGGVVGWNYNGDEKVLRCYYLTGTATGGIGSDNGTGNSAEAKTAEEFASGEIAYLLQGAQGDLIWGQTLSGTADAHPILTSDTAKKVYKVTFMNGATEHAVQYGNTAGVTLPTTTPTKDGHTFEKWSTDESGDTAFTEETAITEDTTVYAQFTEVAPTTYTVTAQSDGNGTASASPTTGAEGTEITLTATANSGYHFKEWQVISGDVTVTENTFTMPGNDVTVKAIFEQDTVVTYTVTAQSAGNGTASASPTAAAAGTEITLTATANDGYHFKEWQVISGGVTVTENTFTMPGNDVTVKAIFEQDAAVTYTVTAQNDGNGTASASPTTGAAGTEITLTATANSGYHFKEWQVISGGVTVTNNTFTMPGNDVTVKAIFEQDAAVTKYLVTVNGGTGGGEYAEGDAVTITATVPGGKRFAGWTVNEGDVTVPNTNPASFTMPGEAVTVTANFEAIPTTSSKPTRPVEETPAVWPFTDVTEQDWCYASVKYVYDAKLMDGISEASFAPDLDTSRAMIATILWRLAGSPEPKAGPTYSDCVADSWYAKAVAWASESGIVKGYDNGNFGPDDPITREQLALMLWRYAEMPAATDKELDFTDAGEASDWALEAPRWAVEAGILTGKGGGVLDPQGQATRAEAATMLQRFREREK